MSSSAPSIRDILSMFRLYLETVRGLAPNTATNYRNAIAAALRFMSAGGPVVLSLAADAKLVAACDANLRWNASSSYRAMFRSAWRAFVEFDRGGPTVTGIPPILVAPLPTSGQGGNPALPLEICSAVTNLHLDARAAPLMLADLRWGSVTFGSVDTAVIGVAKPGPVMTDAYAIHLSPVGRAALLTLKAWAYPTGEPRATDLVVPREIGGTTGFSVTVLGRVIRRELARRGHAATTRAARRAHMVPLGTVAIVDNVVRLPVEPRPEAKPTPAAAPAPAWDNPFGKPYIPTLPDPPAPAATAQPEIDVDTSVDAAIVGLMLATKIPAKTLVRLCWGDVDTRADGTVLSLKSYMTKRNGNHVVVDAWEVRLAPAGLDALNALRAWAYPNGEEPSPEHLVVRPSRHRLRPYTPEALDEIMQRELAKARPAAQSNVVTPSASAVVSENKDTGSPDLPPPSVGPSIVDPPSVLIIPSPSDEELNEFDPAPPTAT